MTDRFVTVPDSLELPAAVKVGVDRLHDSTVAGRALLAAADAAAQRVALELGSAATTAATDYATAAQGDKADAADVDQIVLTGNLVLTIPAGHPAASVYRATITQTTGGHMVTYNDQPVAVDLTAGAVTTVELHPTGAGYVVRYPVADLDAQVSALAEDGGSALGASLSSTYVAGAVSTAAQETAALGAELITSSGWTLGAGWAGDFATGFTFTYAGSLGALTWAPGFLTGTKTYMVEFTVDSVTNSSDFTVTLGGSFGMVMYEGPTGGTHVYSRGIQSTADGSLVFTPTGSLFDGTIRAVSVTEVTASFAAPSVWDDSTGAVALEVRPTTAALGNIFIGEEAGRFNVSGHGNAIVGRDAMRASVSGFWNAAVGMRALESNINGTRNAAVGVYALQYNIDGHRNIAIGPFALRGNTHGKGNIGLGADVMWLNETGDYNIALGQAALGEMVDGDNNIAIGLAALANLDNSSDNIAIGDYAMAFFPGGSQPNIAIGQDVLRNAQAAGVSNTGIGNLSLSSLTTAADCVGIGNQTLAAVTTAGHNTALGSWAGKNITGIRNTAFGSFALQGAAGSTAARNTGIGYSSLALITSGSYNVAIGSSAGVSITTGNNNILIGDNVQGFSATENYYLNIGDTLYGRMGSAKRLGIGVADPKAKLHLPAATGAANTAPVRIDAGTLLTTPEAGAIEFDGTSLYFTTAAGARQTLAVVA